MGKIRGPPRASGDEPSNTAVETVDLSSAPRQRG